jgi:hypothetical protein
MRKARVFISCGQRIDREISIGKSVEDFIKGKGFETYFAERVHSPDALTDNIFKFLGRSEYFVFIDFKREEINKDVYRGSLFVNQEVAIATFLKIPGAGFCEKGVKREGILAYQIYNEAFFEDGTEIIRSLEDIIKTWDANSVNELEICRAESYITKDVRLNNHPDQPMSDWCHLVVKNNNKHKHAFSCHAYLTKITDIENNIELEMPTNELVWSGIGELNVNIMGGTSRNLDAFYVIEGEQHIRFHQRPISTSNPVYRIPDLSAGKYLLEYTIISSDFNTTKKTFNLNFTGTRDSILFSEVDDTLS